ncbi:MAG: ATP--guanido phosphotransferase, partial [Candidatus Omnitrophota bacterium]
MGVNDLLKQTCEWLKGVGPNSEIIISSRIRLARNLKGIPFAHWATKKQAERVLLLSKEAIIASDYMKNSMFFPIADLSNIDKQILLERHLVSRELITSADHKAVAISPNEVISIMINEEDHLRMQVIESGFNLQDVWKL